MPPDYLAVLAASYDYEAQSEDEISITEGQLLLLLEKVDDEYVASAHTRHRSPVPAGGGK